MVPELLEEPPPPLEPQPAVAPATRAQARADRMMLLGAGALPASLLRDVRLRETEEEAHKRVIEALQFVELEQTIAKFPPELSGGMRRRVSIARAIISSPDLILYDSPTGGLDPITSTTIVDLVIKQRDVSHTTALMITHRLQDAFLLARNRFNSKTSKVEPIPSDGIDDSTKFLVLNEGKVVFDGTTHELVHSTDPWLRDYLS